MATELKLDGIWAFCTIARFSELNYWADKRETKAEVDNLLRGVLWKDMPEGYGEIKISEYLRHIYEYICMRYKEFSNRS